MVVAEYAHCPPYSHDSSSNSGARFNRLPVGNGISVIISVSLHLSVSLTTLADMVNPP